MHSSETLAKAQVPPAIAEAIRLGRLTALLKENGRCRVIVTSDLFRRLVVRIFAPMHAAEFQETCLPFQLGLSTKIGAEDLTLLARILLEIDPDKVIVSLDGIGAFDHIKRNFMLSKLSRVPSAKALMPFVHMFYGQESCFLWSDDQDVQHEIWQGDRGEQGDPLMPALFALGQHDALVAARSQLHQGDDLMAFLDDLYLMTTRDRAA